MTSAIRLFLTIMLFVIVLGGAVAVFARLDPESYEKIFLKVDVLGITPQSRDEIERMDKIDALDIPFEQREVLKKRTIFIGASKEMVKLAFGESTSPPRTNMDNKEVWIYFFDDYDRPIYLTFEGNILTGAQKGSSADLAEFK